MPLSLKNKT